jgi:hypothetical protein
MQYMIKTYTLLLAVFLCISPLYGQRAPINVNLIIDGSTAFLDVKEEVTSWICNRLDQLLVDGDRVTVWNAESVVKVIHSGSVNGSDGREAVKKSIREQTASGSSASVNADFSGALRQAAGQREISSFSYTLLISASADALSPVLESPQADLLKFSRVEEFSSWRALVVGLNLDAKVKRAAASFFGS